MKYIKQFSIILGISFLGEVLRYLIPLPVPASIYGVVILFMGLEMKVIRLEEVKETGEFLVEIMPVMFVPAAVGLIDSWGVVQKSAVSYLLIMAVSTVLVMAVSGRVTQWIMNRKKGSSDAGGKENE